MLSTTSNAVSLSESLGKVANLDLVKASLEAMRWARQRGDDLMADLHEQVLNNELDKLVTVVTRNHQEDKSEH